jgi:hypothetical protein
MAAILLYWPHSFPLACLMFSQKLCCVRRPQFPPGNLSEVGAQHVKSVSHDSVKPTLFCFFCQVGSGDPTTLWETKIKKGRFDMYKALGCPSSSDLNYGAYNYTCSHGLQPWVWCLTTPQAYSISTTCTLLHYIRVFLVRRFILWVPTGPGKYWTAVLLYRLHSFPAFCCQYKRFSNLWEAS